MIYEFRCQDCGQVQEVWMKMSDPNPTECPLCNSPRFERIISATSFALKGTGWYTTDYKRAPAATPAKGAENSSEKTSEKSPEKVGEKSGATPGDAAKANAPVAPAKSSSGGES